MSAFFFWYAPGLSADGVNRARVNTGAAVDAGIGVDCPLATLFADGVNRAGVVTSAAVDAFFRNFMSQDFHLLFLSLLVCSN
jgi:hypothetical protein